MAVGRYEGSREAAWTGFVHAQARLMQRLGQELEDAGKVPLSTYDVLVQLAENGGRLRLRDLVDRVVLSQPGLSRKVARLEDEGLVERLPDPHDGRGVLVRITRAGRAALRTAAVVHISGIEREFTARITDDEAETLARVFTRLLDGGELPDQADSAGSAKSTGSVGSAKSGGPAKSAGSAKSGGPAKTAGSAKSGDGGATGPTSGARRTPAAGAAAARRPATRRPRGAAATDG